MKKLISSFIIVFMVLILQGNYVFASTAPRVIDNGSLITSGEKEGLEKTISTMKEKYKFDIVIVTTLDLQGKTPQSFADDFYDEGGFGVGDTKDGILFLISSETRDYYISTTGSGISKFPDYEIDYIGENAVSMLKDNHYYEAMKGFLSDCESRLSKLEHTGGNASNMEAPSSSVVEANIPSVEENVPAVEENTTESIGSTIVGTIGLSMLISLGIVLFMRRKHKTAKPQQSAHGYIKDNGFHLRVEENVFLYSNLSKTKIHKDPPSSGGSIGGSSTHTSSSGQTHGGGGGKF